MRRGALLHEVRGHEVVVCHTPAHRTRAQIDMLPGPECRIAIGKWNADALAKHALSLHPQHSQNECDVLNLLLDKSAFAA